MFKISRNLSITLSLILSISVGVGTLAGAFFVPQLIDTLSDMYISVKPFKPIFTAGIEWLTVLGFMVLAVLLIADILMIILLLNLRTGHVFCQKNVSLIRGVSWCAMAFGLVFAVIGLYFALGFVVTALSIFLGLCLRVVKNIIEEAVAIKAENDLTV